MARQSHVSQCIAMPFAFSCFEYACCPLWFLFQQVIFPQPCIACIVVWNVKKPVFMRLAIHAIGAIHGFGRGDFFNFTAIIQTSRRLLKKCSCGCLGFYAILVAQGILIICPVPPLCILTAVFIFGDYLKRKLNKRSK